MIRKSIKLIHEGKYVAEVAINLENSDESWSPTMPADDAHKLDTVRLALQRGDIAEAGKDRPSDSLRRSSLARESEAPQARSDRF